jgi:predicted nucleic acid-binding protein
MTPTVVLDASAVVALAHGEPGADAVAPHVDGACISTVNWSEVARVSVAVGRDPAALHALLDDAGCRTIDFTVDDATLAARLWEGTWPLTCRSRMSCTRVASRDPRGDGGSGVDEAGRRRRGGRRSLDRCPGSLAA